jgi:hypothetical protein
MLWQIVVELQPFFVLALFTLILLRLPSYSLSICFVLPLDRFFLYLEERT